MRGLNEHLNNDICKEKKVLMPPPQKNLHEEIYRGGAITTFSYHKVSGYKY